MDELKKQAIIDLLEGAKAHIEAGETTSALEKINAAIAEVENEGVDTADATPGGDPENPPLPGEGSNGH